MKRTTLFAMVLALVGCVTPPTQEELAAADYGLYPHDYETIIKTYMSRVLKDPDSGRFEFLNAPKTAWNKLDGLQYGYAVCANINAKNSYGGYTGFQMSYFLIRNGRVIIARHSSGRYGDAMVSGLCQHFI